MPLRAILGGGTGKPDMIHTHDGRSARRGIGRATLGGAALVRTQTSCVRLRRYGRAGAANSSLLAHRLVNNRLDGYVCVSVVAADAARERRDPAGPVLAVIPAGVRLASAEHVARARFDCAGPRSRSS